MADAPTLKDEHQMLVGELRQNRQIQLQTFSTTPIWLSLFFGLVSSGNNEALKTAPALSLIPIPLLFIGLLLIVDRRHSSDVIIAYFRTAYDQQLAIAPGWNYLLPTYREKLRQLSVRGDAGRCSTRKGAANARTAGRSARRTATYPRPAPDHKPARLLSRAWPSRS